MRLLDRIGLSRWPLRVLEKGAVWRLPSACDFAAEIRATPQQVVVTDRLLRLCVELAYAEKDALVGCLDWIELPASQLWLEWNDPVKRAELARVTPAYAQWAQSPVLQKGMLLTAQAGVGGPLRCCRLRTFFTQESDPGDVLVMATQTHVDLVQKLRGDPAPAFLDGGTVVAYDRTNAGLNSVLQHAGFQLDPAWQRYYRSAVAPAGRMEVVRSCLGGVAFDIPIVVSLLLLLSLRTGLVKRAADDARADPGPRSLLRHLEIAAASCMTPEPAADELRQVRGHLVRRGDRLSWRRPHWRGPQRPASRQNPGASSPGTVHAPGAAV